MTGKKILVTGGAGYIGSHTAVELITAGYEVIIADNLSNSSEEVIGRIEQICSKKPGFYKIDLCDTQALNDLFEKEKNIEVVIHFAGYKAVGESVQKPLMYYHNNILSSLVLMQTMEKHKVNHLVFSSSCTVYGQPDTLPVSEKAPIKKAESPYGNTKQIIEEILQEQSNVSELKVVSLRYFNPIGAHTTALIGELPNGIPNNLLPFITQTAIGKRAALTVFGIDYDTRDGSCIRDYIHVVDLAKAHVKACERLINKKNTSSFEVFNIGTGNGFTVLEVIKAFEEVSSEKLRYVIGPRREGDVEQVYADTQLAEKELGWKAELNLTEMVRSAWKWEKTLAGRNSKS